METTLNILIPIIFVTALVIERVRPAQPLPRVRRWLLKGFVFFALAGVINATIPAVLAQVFAGHGLFPLAGLNVVAGGLIAWVASDLLLYWIHRAMHTIQPLWRWTHQLHHSAERMDIAGAVYSHPIDLAINVLAASFVGVVLGVSPAAAGLAGFIAFATAMFQHLNVRTPRWIGYVIQRPEQHSLHHARGIHAYNYGTLMLWDLAFGTFRNPRDHAAEVGFYPGASARLGAMLLGRDIAR